MKKLGSILLKGLVTILPIGLTVYFVYWLGVTTENLLSKPIKLVIDDAHIARLIQHKICGVIITMTQHPGNHGQLGRDIV